MWRMRVVHATGYAYKSPVTASFNEARLTPRSDSRQNVILNRVETVPATRSYRYVDYWGTAVTAFDLHAPHTELEVTASSVVETDKPETAEEQGQLGRPGVGGGDRPVRRGASPRRDYTPASKRIERVGRRIAKYHDPHEAVIEAARWVHGELRVRAGHHRRALLGAGRAARGQGRLPGLRAPDADAVAQHGNSGAVRVGLSASQAQRRRSATPSTGRATRGSRRGRASGGTTTPPTTSEINEQYISVGVGRDYADVTPLKGIYSGEGSTDLDVVVEITRLA